MSFLEGLFNIFKTKKLPKSDEELLLDEYASIYGQIKEKNLNEYDFLCEFIRLLSFLRARCYDIYLEKCLADGDAERLNDLIFQYAKLNLLPGCSGGYDQCERLIPAFFAIACGDTDGMTRIFPKGLPPSKNGYKFLCVTHDLLTAMLWQDENLLTPALEKARAFAESKKPANEREAVKFVLALHEKDVAAMSEHLQKFCSTFGRTDAPKFEKRLYIFAHGLHALAHYFLPLELFKEIKLPKNENFSKFYAKRLFQNEIPKPKLYFTFPPEFELINVILSAPVAKTLIYQPYLPNDKTFFLDHSSMIRNLADEIIKSGALK
ncbi:hypothetical protein [Campylobacter concisus]|uniref:hypothetical protein n=1 Tax=Campylobacter concisus TaxID=199 RepID=UPI0009297707|nr:hypothetical protein [Campylobacter concisus]OJJ29231.1 hypothetical protein TH67_00135 [Campylobacter concisus]